ncbi:MAG: hypothetical protein Tsb009_09520 [Planctomycetaceae bacterium]
MRFSIPRHMATCLLLSVVCSTTLVADEYYEVPLDKLTILEGKLPTASEDRWRFFGLQSNLMMPYAILDGEGEIYLGRDVAPGREMDWRLRRQIEQMEEATREFEDTKKGVKRKPIPKANHSAIAIRIPKKRKITGTLFVPNQKYTAMSRVRFSVPASLASPKSKTNFYLTKRDYYIDLQSFGIPGGSWFRYQAMIADSQATGKKILEPIAAARPNLPDEDRTSELENQFRIFSGGRAISENLQLDRLLRATKPAEPSVELKKIRGITVAEIDWKPLVKDLKPTTDPLAKLIPHDQHVIFFRDFPSLTTVLDEATAFGTPFLHLLQKRAEDSRTKDRYQRQLCLELSALSRLLGPKVIRGVAFTGSDPYLRTGTDVAIIFDARSPVVLTSYLSAKHLAAVNSHAGCQRVAGKIAGIKYSGAVSPNRMICSYMSVVGDAVIVTNSLVQLERLAKTFQGREKSLSSLPEYTFFRNRYRINDEDESGLLIVTDATIRRWCGPKWRIATSRRTRAYAIMAHYQAEHLQKIVSGNLKARALSTRLHVPDLGTLMLTSDGVTSSEYGSLEFMTPIAEMDFDRVTPDEEAAYRSWRNQYQNYWRQYFDPIAVRFSMSKQRLSADVTVMPLIQQSQYGEFVQLTSGVKIASNAGDRHPETLLHWAMAVNPKSFFSQRIAGFLPVNPFSWLGDSVAVFVDPDPFWRDLAKAKDKDQFFQNHLSRLPVAFQAEVKSSLKLTLFLAGVRGFIEKSAPGMLTWETKKHENLSYVKVSPTPDGRGQLTGLDRNLAIYYRPSRERFTITFNENVLKRTIEREVQRKKFAAQKSSKSPVAKNKVQSVKPWLGTSMALHMNDKSLAILQLMYRENYQRAMQGRAWANLPILNVWKRLYPKKDPVAVHQQLWQVRLRCPGGGRYVWNERFQTMESTVYGHPAAPKPGPDMPAEFSAIKDLNFGLTFEHKGLRARMILDRKSKPVKK